MDEVCYISSHVWFRLVTKRWRNFCTIVETTRVCSSYDAFLRLCRDSVNSGWETYAPDVSAGRQIQHLESNWTYGVA